MTLREKIEVMQAFERGEEIEYSWTNWGTRWEIVKSPSWDWTSYLYRIKPKPKQTEILYEWLICNELNAWSISDRLRTEEEASTTFKEYDYKSWQKTGRSFEVEL